MLLPGGCVMAMVALEEVVAGVVLAAGVVVADGVAVVVAAAGVAVVAEGVAAVAAGARFVNAEATFGRRQVEKLCAHGFGNKLPIHFADIGEKALPRVAVGLGSRGDPQLGTAHILYGELAVVESTDSCGQVTEGRGVGDGQFDGKGLGGRWGNAERGDGASGELGDGVLKRIENPGFPAAEGLTRGINDDGVGPLGRENERRRISQQGDNGGGVKRRTLRARRRGQNGAGRRRRRRIGTDLEDQINRCGRRVERVSVGGRSDNDGTRAVGAVLNRAYSPEWGGIAQKHPLPDSLAGVRRRCHKKVLPRQGILGVARIFCGGVADEFQSDGLIHFLGRGVDCGRPLFKYRFLWRERRLSASPS